MKLTDKQKKETDLNIKAFENALSKMEPDHEVFLQRKAQLVNEIGRISAIKAQLEAQLKQFEAQVENSNKAIQQTKDALEQLRLYRKGITPRDQWIKQQRDDKEMTKGDAC